MVGEKRFKAFAETVFKNSDADQTEVLFNFTKRNLTRYSKNEIHQNMDYEQLSASVRVIYGKKIGVAHSNIADEKDLLKTLDTAKKIAGFQKEDKDFISLPNSKEIQKIEAVHIKTKDIGPEEKANVVAKVAEVAEKEGMETFGAFETVYGEQVVANSLGVWAYHPYTEAQLSVLMQAEDSSGFVTGMDKNVENIDAEKIAKEAAEKAKMSKNPVDLEPGKYDVILEPAAVSDMLGYMAYQAFGAKAYHEGRSFLSEKMDKKILGENVNIKDNSFHKYTIPMPFDFEGVPREELELISEGILKNIVYDTREAGKQGKKSTGHALQAPSQLGAIPLHLELLPGEYSVEDMVKSIKKGVYVTRFHYVNAHHHKLLNITGMTRDGTLLIENGKITKGIKNMRFTQSIPEAFNNIEMIGKDQKLVENIGYIVTPAIKVKNFHFTSKTEF